MGDGDIVPANSEVRLKELELSLKETQLLVDLAKYGLRGTLFGAFAGMIFILLLTAPALWLNNYILTGWHICVITGLLSLAVILYGAFVFNQQVKIAASMKDSNINIESGGRTAK